MLKKMTDNEIAHELLSKLNRRLGKSEENTTFAIATFLDPRFLSHFFQMKLLLRKKYSYILLYRPTPYTINVGGIDNLAVYPGRTMRDF